MAVFLFLEIADRQVVTLLNELRGAFSEKPRATTVHITLRGPYKELPQYEELQNFSDLIRQEGVLISGVGTFSDDKTNVVFLRVQNPKLRKLLWKPDFPRLKHGFHPHITIYEGKDREKADAIARFLQSEKLVFLCNNVSLRLHDTTQPDLFSNITYWDRRYIEPPQISGQFERLRPNIVRRARLLSSTLSRPASSIEVQEPRHRLTKVPGKRGSVRRRKPVEKRP